MTDAFQFACDTFAGPEAQPTGFGTPSSDKTPQVCFVPPRRVIPIIFLPGIMGSNLRITSANRIRLLRRKDSDPERDIAWRPDTYGLLNASEKSNLTPAERQLMLDPATTAVDVYNRDSIAPAEDGDVRNGNVALSLNYPAPLLTSDFFGAGKPRTAVQKARERGWGEVFFGSYGELLQRVESRLQCLFHKRRLAFGWDQVIGVDPARWHLDPSTPQSALTEEELKAITKDTFFPVHAIGYNWLIDNRVSAATVAGRIREIVKVYGEGSTHRHECPGVIVVTHSMGGLLGRALIHPAMGGLKDLVLGIVHGVQPATGAAAAYRRMRAGFEDTGMWRGPESSITAKIAGNYGDEVTAVLANSAGGLQLLPSKAYGNGWLRVVSSGRELLRLPANGDPYEEIYKLRGKWYGLIADESWLNPAKQQLKGGATHISRTTGFIDDAQQFHDALVDTYHEYTYVHYGADRKKAAFGNVTWQFGKHSGALKDWNDWPILGDDRQGRVSFTTHVDAAVHNAASGITSSITATIDPPEEAGDETVPVRSSDHQKQPGRCKAVFRQTGYDHQGSYKDEAVLASTLYSILRIAQRVQTT